MDSLTSMLKQKHKEGRHFYISKDAQPISIRCREGYPGQIVFSDGTSCYGKCLGCKNKPCIFFSANEIQSDDTFKFFPADGDNRICASNAIQWDENKSCPTVDSTQCILCGVCLRRCPTKALYLSANNGVQCACPEKDDPVFISANQRQDNILDQTISELNDVTCVGETIRCIDSNLETAYSNLLEVAKTEGPQFPNLLSRNMLNALGVKAIMRRRGDVYLRTDIVFENEKKRGLCEVEFFPNVMLDAPRDILDDMAVFISRFGLEKNNIQPLIIGLELPNQRSEYWQVIADIQKVLGVRISTLTIGALLLLLWKQKSIHLSNQNLPYGDDESFSIREGVSELLGEAILCNCANYSLFESRK